MDELQPFDEEKNLVSLLGIGSLPEAERQAIIEEATEVIEKRVMLKISSALTESERQEIEQLEDNADALAAYLSAKRPDLADLYAEEVERLRSELSLAAAEAEFVQIDEDGEEVIAGAITEPV